MSKIYEALQKAQRDREAAEHHPPPDQVEAPLQVTRLARPPRGPALARPLIEAQPPEPEAEPHVVEEPTRAEPRPEPRRAEPRRAEPRRAEPRRAEPRRTEPRRQAAPQPEDAGGAATRSLWPSLLRRRPAGGPNEVVLPRPKARWEKRLAEEVAALYRPIVSHLEEGRGVVAFIGVDDRDDTARHVARSFAQYLAESGRHQALLVDGHRGNQSQFSHFGLVRSGSLAAVADGDLDLSSAVSPLGNTGLSIAAMYGEPDAPAIAPGSPRLASVMADLRRRFELSVLDCAAGTDAVDGVALAADADLTVLVMRRDHTEANRAQRLKAQIASAGGNPFGIVLSVRTPRIG